MSSEVTAEAVHGLMFLSLIFGIGVGLVSLLVIPWYAAVGLGVLGALFCFMGVAFVFSIEPR